jgi:hypothetical protein
MLPCVDAPELVQSTERAAKEQARKERQKEYNKAYRLKNIDAIKAQKHEHYAKNRDRISVQHKKYHAANKDHMLAKMKEWHAKNKNARLAQKREWHAANKDSVKAYKAKHRDRISARGKEWYAKNRDACQAKSREWHAKNRDRRLVQIKEWKLRKHGCLECKDWPDGQQGYSHYDGYCWRCFSDKFRDDERVKTRGRVELKVRSYLDSHFKEFVHDQPIHTAHCVCSHRRRVDHRRLIGNTLLCVETDENFHRYYDPDDEEARYHDVILAWGGKLCFVRFNPHKFNLDDRYDHGPPLEERLERLRAEVTRHIGRLERGENTAFLEVYHLYYPAGTEDYCEEEDGSTH